MKQLWIALALLQGCLLAGEMPVWAAPEGHKIDKFGKKIFVKDPSQDLEALKKSNGIWDAATKTISIAGARGETVALQLGIEGEAAGLANVNVEASTLSSVGAALPAETVALYKIYYTQCTDKGSGPTNWPSLGQGWYPDALVPWSIGDVAGYDGPPFAVKGNEIQGVWIDIAIPYGTAAGEYAGTLTVSAEGGATTALKLKLRVRDFDIPRQIHKTFFMNFGMEDLNQAGGYWLQGAKLDAYEDEVYRIARRHRFTAGNMYSSARPVVEEAAGELKSVDWRAYDAQADKVLNPKKNIFGPGEPPLEIWKAPLNCGISFGPQFPAGEKAWDQMLVEIKKHWQEKGWDLNSTYVYLADEPGKENAEKLNAYAKRVKASPGANLRRQIAVYTILGKEWNGQQWVFDLWKDNLDMWMVAGDYYHVPSMNALPAGTLKGMYQGSEPFQGNETLDSDGVAMRTWSWIAWCYKVDYLCYYSMSEAWRGFPNGKTFNNCEIWDKPRNRPWALSQGVFIYPGKKLNYDLPIVNIRMKQIRRGQTDYEYFWLLNHAGEGALADKLCKGVIKSALSEAAAGAEQYTREGGLWSHNPAVWDDAIKQAGDKLESIKAKLPKEPAALAAAAK